MNGADQINIPSQSQNLGEANGDKNVEDLIEPGTKIAWNGLTGTPDGTVKYVDNYGEQYEEGEQSGHFFPIEFDKKYYNEEINVGGQNGVGGKNITPKEDDPYLIIRIENVTVDDKITAVSSKTKDEVFTLDFSKVKLPDVAVMGQDEQIEYGNKTASELMDEDVRISWTGEIGHVLGTFPEVTDWSQLPHEPRSGHFFACRINKKYLGKPFTHSKGDDEGTTVPEAKEDEMFWVLNIDDKKKHTFKSGDSIIAVLDFAGVNFKS